LDEALENLMTTLSTPFIGSSERRAVSPHNSSPAVAGDVRLALRAEGLAMLAAATALYAHAGHSGWLFATLFLVPDLSLLGYLAGPRAGAIIYNSAHSLLGPLALGLGAVLAAPALGAYALIWLAHIGFDRALGYGLKYATAFGHTHLGRIGRAGGKA
jgi:hypothetical protein